MHSNLMTIVAAISLLFANSVLGQDSSRVRINSLVEGANAIQFAIDRDFQLNSFRGSFLSYKIVTSKRSATRFGLSISRSSSHTPILSVQNNGTIFDTELDSLNWSVQFTAHRVFNSRPTRRLSFFWGFGPTAGYTSKIFEGTRITKNSGSLPPTQVDVSNKDFRNWNIGVYGNAGFEFFLFQTISLFVERAAIIVFESSRTTVTRESFSDGVSFFRDETEDANKSLVLRQNVLRLGLSLYFDF